MYILIDTKNEDDPVLAVYPKKSLAQDKLKKLESKNNTNNNNNNNNGKDSEHNYAIFARVIE